MCRSCRTLGPSFLEPTTLWLGLATALVAVLGAFAVQRYVAFRAASVKFRSAVLGALQGLYPLPSNWPTESVAIDRVLRAAFPALQSAVAEFEPVVPWWQRKAFAQAWFTYHCSPGRTIDSQVYHHYIGFSGQPEPKEAFRANIGRLLSFAART